MKLKLLSLSFSALVLLFFAGCATQHSVRLDGLSATGYSGPSRGTTYELTSRTEGVEEDDLFFQEIARFIHPALKESGFRQAPEGTKPDVIIRVNAYLSDPLVETRSYSDPVYLDRPGYSQTVRIPIVGQDGKVIRYAYRQYYTPPRTSFAGYVDRDQQMTVYDKVLHLSARKSGEDGKEGPEVWSLKISLRGPSTDYRSALPIMLVAAQPYIGLRTKGEQTVTISEDDENLQAYRAMIGDGR